MRTCYKRGQIGHLQLQCPLLTRAQPQHHQQQRERVQVAVKPDQGAFHNLVEGSRKLGDMR
ncbi:hypothetical protein Sjap_002389 [Stephania japonica]|uniref:CCHC-type domain-containing protein n=1 Tax=Stephania japonica TaxID=461633 RepID=A0AAP0KNK5_9MAGN